MRCTLTVLIFFLSSTLLFAQNLTNLEFKNIGPTVMSGRVVDIDVNPQDPTEFLVAYASGGLWHTTNNGTSFSPIMDNAITINLGDIAVDWKNKTIWAGTGENNASRSSYAGVGIIKSSDWGKTWSTPMLKNSQHIGRIIINPDNPNNVVVAVTGPLYSLSEERGMYSTMDGGKTWNKTLFIDDKTGFIDLAHDPNNFNTQYATSWEKDRKAWNFDGAGNGSAIYKSEDAGLTWTKISTVNSGFPTGIGVGRIGLSVFDDNTLYAIHDSQFRRDKKDGDNASAKANSKKINKEDFKSMSTDDFLKLDNKVLNAFLKENGFQEKYRAESVKNLIQKGEATPADVALYLEDANSQLFDTPVKGAELYRSDDAGKTWYKTHEGQIDDVFYSYGYYFAQVRVNPRDINEVYIMGVPIITSNDGGKTFKNISRENVHADHHALWVNPNKQGHLINGNDGGVNISYDNGETWIKNNTPSVGQFYAINYDLEEPYHVYGGLQDNGVWVGSHTALENRAWHQSGQYPWESIMGGDGMQIQIDNRNSNIVYTGFQFGNYFRLNRENGDRTYIQPKHKLGESPYRFNWQTPILLSSHNQDILYLGGNKLMRSLDQGDTWTAISPDLTKGGKPGNVAYGTITTISESKFEFGLIYAGTDDGLVQLTKNGGGNWEQIDGPWPNDLWVSRVTASSHKKSRVYVTLNGYRWDDFQSYVYKSEDYGKTWERLATSIPGSPVNVITEHPMRENYLFIGTDNATYASLDQGNTWTLLSGSMPPVAVHDIKIQPQTNDLLIGTHGRSIYLANLNALDLVGTKFKMASIEDLRFSRRYGSRGFLWSNGPTPKIQISYFNPTAGKVNLEVKNEAGKTIYETAFTSDQGLNFYTYDGSISKAGLKAFKKGDRPDPAQNGVTYLPKGTYTVHLSGNSGGSKETLVVK